jgi:hypothetical protein
MTDMGIVTGRRDPCCQELLKGSERRLRVVDDGQDFGGHLNHPATLAAGLTTQTLKRLPLTQTFPGNQRPLSLLDHHPSVQGPLELLGQLAPLLALHGVGDGERGQVGEGDQASSPSGDQGWALAENTTTTPIACWL